MVPQRLEVRLDPNRKQKIEKIAELRGECVSDVIRDLIDQAYDGLDRERRHRAALDLIEMEVGDNPDPETLSRELEKAYEIPDPYADHRYGDLYNRGERSHGDGAEAPGCQVNETDEIAGFC